MLPARSFALDGGCAAAFHRGGYAIALAALGVFTTGCGEIDCRESRTCRPTHSSAESGAPNVGSHDGAAGASGTGASGGTLGKAGNGGFGDAGHGEAAGTAGSSGTFGFPWERAKSPL